MLPPIVTLQEAGCLEPDILRRVAEVKGVFSPMLLGPEDRRSILRLEAEAEKRIMLGRISGINLGVRTVLKMDYVVAALTNMEFEWPKATCILVCDNRAVGEVVHDKNRLRMLREKGEIVLGNLVIYKKLYRKASRRKMRLIILPLRVAMEIEGYWVIVGSPSPPTDHYIKQRLGYSSENPEIGTILVGLNRKTV